MLYGLLCLVSLISVSVPFISCYFIVPISEHFPSIPTQALRKWRSLSSQNVTVSMDQLWITNAFATKAGKQCSGNRFTSKLFIATPRTTVLHK